MARKNSNSNLEQAMTLLIQNQAAFLSQLVSINERFARIEERMDERFAKIEQVLGEHHQILAGLQESVHGLQDAIARLPEAVREKIGFKPRR